MRVSMRYFPGLLLFFLSVLTCSTVPVTERTQLNLVSDASMLSMSTVTNNMSVNVRTSP